MRRARAQGGQNWGAPEDRAVLGHYRLSPAVTFPSVSPRGAALSCAQKRPETQVRAHSPQIPLNKGYYSHKHYVWYLKIIDEQQGFLGTAAKPVRVYGDRRRDRSGGDRRRSSDLHLGTCCLSAILKTCAKKRSKEIAEPYGSGVKETSPYGTDCKI